jgi:hypothetical protein
LGEGRVRENVAALLLSRGFKEASVDALLRLVFKD